MDRPRTFPPAQPVAINPSLRTLQAEMLLLCARIGYSPPAFDWIRPGAAGSIQPEGISP
jgi:hypothetical protein